MVRRKVMFSYKMIKYELMLPGFYLFIHLFFSIILFFHFFFQLTLLSKFKIKTKFFISVLNELNRFNFDFFVFFFGSYFSVLIESALTIKRTYPKAKNTSTENIECDRPITKISTLKYFYF